MSKNKKSKTESPDKSSDIAKKQNKQYLIILVSVLLVAFIIVTIILYRWLLLVTNDQNSDITRSFEASQTMKGYACGVLDEKTAKDFMDADVDKRSYITPSVFYNQPITISDNITGTSGVTEACAYTAVNNSSKYVSFSLTGFADNEAAKTYFEHTILSSPELQRLGEQYGGMLVYSNEGLSLLKGNSIYVVAASNGIVSENKTVTTELLKNIAEKF